MNTTAQHLVRASRFHLIIDKDVRGAELVSDFADEIETLLSTLCHDLATVAKLHGMDAQECADFISNHMGAVSPIDPIAQSDFPALIKAALVAKHKGAA